MFPNAISISPNLLFKDVLISLSFILLPWRWKNLRAGDTDIEKILSKQFDNLGVVTFGSGREALYSILVNMGFNKGDEVLVEGYTCVVVSNAIIWAGLKPVYIDIEKDTYNMDPQDIEHKITNKTRAIIIQHTFGKPADMDAIISISRKHNLKVIEDCAHSLGSKYKGKKLGTFGDAAILSFGRDKVISSVHGGAAVIKDKDLYQRLGEYRAALPHVAIKRVLQHLMHPIITYFFVLPFYNIYLGKIILVISQKLGIISKVFVPGEKKAIKPQSFPTKYPYSLSCIAVNQLKHLAIFNKRRREISLVYRNELKNYQHITVIKDFVEEENIYMRFTVIVDHPRKLVSIAKHREIVLGNWYDTVIAPGTVVLKDAKYIPGECKNAELLATRTVNLPTYYRLKDYQIKNIINVLRAYEDICKTNT